MLPIFSTRRAISNWKLMRVTFHSSLILTLVAAVLPRALPAQSAVSAMSTETASATTPMTAPTPRTTFDNTVSQDPDGQLSHYYALALASNPRIAAARSIARAASYRITQVSRPPDPQVQLGFMNYALPNIAPMDPLGMVQLQFMQMLPLGDKLKLASHAAKAESQAVSAQIEMVSWELRSSVSDAFYDLLTTHSSIEFSRKSLRILQEIAATAEAMYRVGEGQQADVLRARVEISRLGEDTLRLDAIRVAADARLNSLVGRDLKIVSVISAPVFPSSLPQQSWLDSIAETNNPSIRAGHLQIQAAVANERKVNREIIPDLQLGVQVGRGRSASMNGMSKAGFMGSLMIGASVPIFAKSRQFSMREEAQAMREMVEFEQASMQLETSSKIAEVFSELQRIRRLEALYKAEIIPQAEAAITSALSAYKTGNGSFTSVLESRSTLYQFEQQLSQLQGEQGKAWAELEALTGIELVSPTSPKQNSAGGTHE